MDLIKQYSKKPEQSEVKKEHPAAAIAKARDRQVMLEILDIVKNIFSRQNYIKRDTENILRSLNNFHGSNIPCQIPSMTPKQLYLCYKGGWTIKQLSGLSGLDEIVIKTKIDNYIQNST